MKRLAQLGLMLMLAAAAAMPLGAQGALKFGVSGGGTVPVGSFGDLNDPGYNFGVHALISSRFFPQDFKIELQHNQLKLQASDTKTMVTSATLNLELNPGRAIARLAPYLSAGMGAYRVKTDLRGPSPGVTQSGSTTKFGLNAGGGLRFPLGQLNGFLEARYHRVHSDRFVSRSLKFVPIVFGITL